MSGVPHVEVRESGIADAGRGLFAKKDFNPGDLVLAVPRPLIAELETDRLADTCAECFIREQQDRPLSGVELLSPSFGVTVKACGGCKTIKYCSKACQTRAWKREHKYECKAFTLANGRDLPHVVRAVIKMLGRLLADSQVKDKRLPEIFEFRPIAAQKDLDQIRKQNAKLFSDYQALAYGAWKFAGEPKFGDTDGFPIARDLFFNITFNVLTLSSPFDDYDYGIAFDQWICSANHSCDPNVVMVFNQPETVLRALKHIRKGDELFLKYCDVLNPRSIRRHELRSKYHFECDCAKCQQGPSGQQDDFTRPAESLPVAFVGRADELLKKWKSQPDEFAKVLVGTSLPERRLSAMQAEAFSVTGISVTTGARRDDVGLEEVLEALKMLLGSTMWPIERQPVPSLVRKLFGLYLNAGEVYRAFRVGAKLCCEINPKIYPQRFYPDRILDAWAMQLLLNHLCSPDNKAYYDECLSAGLDLRLLFFGFVFEVYDQTPNIYGRESRFGKVIGNIYKQLEQGLSVSVKDMRQKVAEQSPRFEHFAKNVDILAL